MEYLCSIGHAQHLIKKRGPAIAWEAVALAVSGSVWTEEGLENIFFTLMEISLTLDFIFLESLLQIKRKWEERGLGWMLHVSRRILVFNLNKIDFINSD